jgi:signal transduction histidine kinase/ActR/RegA family two-component response regulator
MSARRLTYRYILALGLIGLLAAAILGLGLVSANSGSRDAHEINVAGRQRMLSQRIALFATQMAIAPNQDHRDMLGEELDRAVVLFEDSHLELYSHIDTDPELNRIYGAEGENLHQMSLDFVEMVRVSQAADLYMVDSVGGLAIRSQIILPVLGRAVGAFESRAQRRLEGFQHAEMIAFGVTLLVLLGVGLFIFRPAASSIGRSIARLAQAREDADRARTVAETASQAKSEFLATMSHEIRSPLNGVIAMSALLSDTKMDEGQQLMASTITESGDLLLAIINDVLDLSKAEAGAIELDARPFQFEAVSHWAQSSYAAQCAAKGLDFECDFPDSARVRLIGDDTRLRQILGNLLSNAIKFTATGKVSVALDYDAAREEIAASVTDTGPGVPLNRQEAIFDPFKQASSGTTRDHGGTGLGLAICRRLAKLMEGDVTLESTPGEGSTFTVRVKAAPAPEEAPKEDNDPCDLGEVLQTAPLRLLAVDDIATNRLVIAKLLEHPDVVLEVAESGMEAVEKHAAESYDAVLMDIHMPGMDGMEATRLMRDADREAGREPTPVIAVTADVLTESKRAYQAAGLNACVGKPVDRSALARALRDVVVKPRDAA